MEVHELAEALRRRWLVVVLLVVAGLVGAVVYSETATKLYQSSVQLFVAADGSTSASLAAQEAYEGQLLAQQGVQSYVDLVTTPAVTAPVVRQLALRVSPTKLAEQLSASAPANTVLINIAATAKSAEKAQRIAAAVGLEAAKVISEFSAPANGGRSPVRASISSPAALPAAPSSPRRSLALAVGLLAGLLIGVLCAVTKDRLDTQVHQDAELGEEFGLPVLGTVPLDPQVREAMRGRPSGSLSSRVRLEALRTLRTNLRFASLEDEPSRTVLVTSSVPGEGKSTTACGLAWALAESGARVVLVEADLRNPQLSGYLGLSMAPGVTAALFARDSVESYLVPTELHANISVLPAGESLPNPSEIVDSHWFRTIISTLAGTHDMVIIDAPPLLTVTDGAIIASYAAGTLLVVQPGEVSYRSVRQSIESLNRVHAKIFGLVLNKVKLSRADSYGYGYTSSVDAPASARHPDAPSPSGVTHDST